jgi:hypothetical protein
VRTLLSSPTIASAIVLLIVGIAVVFPAAMVSIDAFSGASAGLRRADLVPEAALLARTIGTAGLIAVLATLLATPAAWTARAWSAPLLLLLLAPMLLPSYLAYSGWGLLRAPGTWLGNMLIRGPAGADPAGNWWPVAASRVQAMLGLVLWSWPLAAGVLVARFRRIDESTLESLRLEPISHLKRLSALLGMARGAIFTAVAAVGLVMLGSAIPLHIAQFETYSIGIWRWLSEMPHQEQWRVWIRAWPLIAVPIVAAILIVRKLDRAAPEQGYRRPDRRIRPLPAAATALVWLLALAVPTLLFLTSLRSLRSMARFWELSWQPLLASTIIAGMVMAVALIMLVCSWIAASGRETSPLSGKVVVVLSAVLLATGLVPGILVGAATGRAWTMLRAAVPGTEFIADSPLIVLVAHVARFGFIPIVAGLLLARTEPRDLADLRRLDAGTRFAGFVRAAMVPQLGIVLAVVLVTGLLSLHEIEAAVILQPPSAVGGGMPWQMLQWLHFARMEDLSAGVLWMVVLALGVVLLAVASAWLGGRAGRAGKGRGAK